MAYKYLLWDIDGTILDFLAAEKATIKSLFLKYGFGECDDDKIARYSAINVRYWQALERNEMTKPEILVGRFREFFASEGLDPEKAEAFNADYQIALGDTVVFCDDCYRLIADMKGKYVLAAVTNGTKIAQDKKLKQSGLDKIFDYVFISEELGYEKPNLAFFEAVKTKLNISDFSEALIIGDSLTSDIKGGNNAGIDTCWYNPRGAVNNTESVKYEISNLWDINKILNASFSLAFTGDIGFDRYMDGKWEDEELIDDTLLDFLKSADHVIANVEGPLVSNMKNTTTEGTVQLMHTMDPNATRVLNKMQADIWNICNNHIMDAGENGVAETLERARECGAVCVGAGMNIDEASKPVIFTEAGGIGMFSVGYQRGCKPADVNKAGCFNWSDLERVRATISEIKKTCKYCIIIAHAGEEFTSLPSPYTRDRYLEYLNMGADIIVAHHPHVPMNFERVGEKIIFYSLGNFIFDTDYQRAQYNTEKGILVKLNFGDEGFSFEAQGLKIDREKEHIVADVLPDIFTNVNEQEYELLKPLAAKMFVSATKRQQIYLNPKEYTDASDEKWEENFMNLVRSGRVPGEALDFQIICPLAEQEKNKAWEQSKLEKVKEYILSQM